MALPEFVLNLQIGTTAPSDAPRPLIDAIQAVEINQGDDDGLGYQPGFQITFAAQRSADQRPEYALLQEPLLQPGHRVIVTVALQAKPRVLFDGIITHQQLTFSSGNGDASLAVMGRDLSVLLDLDEKIVGHKQMKHKEIVENILNRYAKWGIKPQVKSPPTPWPQQPLEHGPFQMATDLVFLRQLAAYNGFVFYVQAGPKPGSSTAYWGPPLRQGDGQRALTVNMGTATNVETLHIAYDALAPVQVKTDLADPNAGELESVAIQQSKRPQLSRKPAFAAQNTLLRTQRLVYSGPDAIEARARSQALADRSTDHVVVVTGALDAVEYGDILMAPGLVGLRGVGVQFDGNYYVKAVKHVITPAMYKQEFTITRDGLGTKTKQVKP